MMCNLTDEERSRIKGEELLRADIRRTIEASTKTESRPILMILNSPFVVTFLGAALIAVLGHLWQQQSIKEQKSLARWEAVQKQKYDLLSSFVQDFESTAMVLGTLYVHRLAFREAKDLQEKSPDDKEVVVKLKEARTAYEKTWSLYQAAPKFNAYTVRVKALYTDTAVHGALNRLDAAMRNVQKSVTIDDVEKNMGPVNKEFETLATAMGAEISHGDI
ncbi:MAG TPA: hypothetical protein PKH07_18545 [bacterium]|nr:hypothetical protein [bacterium]